MKSFLTVFKKITSEILYRHIVIIFDANFGNNFHKLAVRPFKWQKIHIEILALLVHKCINFLEYHVGLWHRLLSDKINWTLSSAIFKLNKYEQLLEIITKKYLDLTEVVVGRNYASSSIIHLWKKLQNLKKC